MHRGPQGDYVTTSRVGEVVRAFIPKPLPPDPPIVWGNELHNKFDQALLALGRLDSVSCLLPDAELFIYMYLRKEALLSSQIEGTQSTLSDVLLFELGKKPSSTMDDAREVLNYVAAIEHGLHLLKEGMPLSLRMLRELHGLLMQSGRGSKQEPGEFRRSQNWIGGSRPGNAFFVPPPHDEVLPCLGRLELFLHEPMPVLMKAALTHAQFETIHPFLDGNGRLGRLLITLILCEQGILRKPLLYLSLYLKTHKTRYYELLNETRFTGDWEAWLDFFADAVIETASQAVAAAERINELARRDREKIGGLGRGAMSALSVYQAFLSHPIADASRLEAKTGLAKPTIGKVLTSLEALGIAEETTGRRRNKIFRYREYLTIMDEGTELPSAATSLVTDNPLSLTKGIR